MKRATGQSDTRDKPGWCSVRRGDSPAGKSPRRLLAQLLVQLFVLLLVAPGVHAFQVLNFTGGLSVNLNRNDIVSGTTSLSNAQDQDFDIGLRNFSLTSLGGDLDIGVAADAAAVLAGMETDTAVFVIFLTNAERQACMTHDDFAISYRLNGGAGTVTSNQGGGGSIAVPTFTEVPRLFPQFGVCPPWLWYGVNVSLEFSNAVAAGTYNAPLVIEGLALRGGFGQAARTTSMTATVPSFLVMHYASRIDIDVTPAALASHIDANAAACTGGSCSNQGTVMFAAAGTTVDADINSASTTFSLQPTMTLRNVVAARALGCTGNSYNTARYDVRQGTAGVVAGNGTITSIQGQGCGGTARSGDVPLTLDLTEFINGASTATALIDLTVTGF